MFFFFVVGLHPINNIIGMDGKGELGKRNWSSQPSQAKPSQPRPAQSSQLIRKIKEVKKEEKGRPSYIFIFLYYNNKRLVRIGIRVPSFWRRKYGSGRESLLFQIVYMSVNHSPTAFIFTPELNNTEEKWNGTEKKREKEFIFYLASPVFFHFLAGGSIGIGSKSKAGRTPILSFSCLSIPPYPVSSSFLFLLLFPFSLSLSFISFCHPSILFSSFPAWMEEKSVNRDIVIWIIWMNIRKRKRKRERRESGSGLNVYTYIYRMYW